MTTAKNIGRIDVWPDNGTASAADTADSKVLGRMTIWRTSSAARAHTSLSDGGGGGTETVNDITLLNNSSETSISMPEVGTVTTVVDIEFNDHLTEIDLSGLVMVGGDLTILHSEVLISQNLSSLTTVGGVVNLQDNYVLPLVDLSALVTVGGEFAIQGHNALTALLLPSLESCANGIQVFDCPELTELALPSLSSVGGVGPAFSVHSNAALVSGSAPQLPYIYSLIIYENTVLQTFDLSAAATVANVVIHDNPQLTAIYLPAMTYTEYLEGIHDNPACTSISFPAVEQILFSGIALTAGMGAVTSYTLGASLKQLDGNVTLTSCALTEASVDSFLVRLAALDGTAGTTSYTGKTVTITGTSAPPSATGLAAKATLEGRGNTVTVNS